MKRSLFFLCLLFSFSVFAQKKILVLGDSLSEGLGVAADQAYPALLEQKIKTSGKSWTVINASVSGSTSASAVSRLKWQIKAKPSMMILAMGANDGLRGLPVAQMKKNLREAIAMAQKENITVVLAGMILPPNYNKDYSAKFAAVYTELAAEKKLKLIPFLLDKVGGESKLNQADGLHPNEQGHKIIADTVYNSIKELL